MTTTKEILERDKVLRLRARPIPMPSFKQCGQCGSPIFPKTYPGGQTEKPSTIAKRRYCSTQCAHKFRFEQKAFLTSVESGRRQAQRLYEATACSLCGTSEGRIDRHHRDSNTLNNHPSNIAILCASCHAQEHWRMGSQANRPVKTHCKHGHEFDEANTRIRPDGARTCRACARDWANAHYVPRTT